MVVAAREGGGQVCGGGRCGLDVELCDASHAVPIIFLPILSDNRHHIKRGNFGVYIQVRAVQVAAGNLGDGSGLCVLGAGHWCNERRRRLTRHGVGSRDAAEGDLCEKSDTHDCYSVHCSSIRMLVVSMIFVLSLLGRLRGLRI